MALEPQDLDTRGFDELFEAARARIPRYAPEWTDFNDSDPGITLLQLYAWLTELQLYALNRVPDRSYVKFLQVLGLELEPAQPARAQLTFTPSEGTRPAPVPPRTPIAAANPAGGPPLVFETLDGLDLIAAALTDVRVFDGSAFADVTPANAAPGTTFWPLGFAPQPGAALYLGFSPAEVEPVFPQQLRLRVFLPPAGAAVARRAAEAEDPPAPPVTLEWEYFPGEGAPAWRRLALHRDDSAAFTREGAVLVQGPGTIEPAVQAGVEEPRYWLRCRLAAGAYPADGAPEIDFVRPNVVAAENVTTQREEVLGQAEGHPGERLKLRHAPVQAGSLVLEIVSQHEGAERWEATDELLAAGPDDRRYVLNPTTGEVTFGDGRHGRIPPRGADVVAVIYRYGGGAAGNVGADQIAAPLTALPGVDAVTNERPAEGGREEQTVEDLKQRAPSILRSRGRAVTADDFAALAERAGGVLKAKAIPLAHPDHPGVEVPGAITVAIVPDAGGRPPEPSAALIEHVSRALNRQRLLTTELYVAPPAFTPITVHARVAAQPYAAFDAVALAVRAALDAYLDPRTWAFGRDLYPTGLFSVLTAVPDVVAVRTLQVYVGQRPWEEPTRPIVLGPDGLVYGTDAHEVVVEPWSDL